MAVLLVACGLSGVAGARVLAQTDGAGDRTITSLGRLEPGEGVISVSGPSGPDSVIRELRVREGDRVESQQVLAVLDTLALREAEVARLGVQLEQAESELARVRALRRGAAAAQSKLDDANFEVRVARAELAAAQAERERSLVRAPISGQVLEIHARVGERVGPDGVLEMGETDSMFAVAEVYETDIGGVQPGQRARITSPALPAALEGVVERIGLKIGRMDVLDTDPVAKTDARVVEVRIRLDGNGDSGDGAARLTYLQVEVEIFP